MCPLAHPCLRTIRMCHWACGRTRKHSVVLVECCRTLFPNAPHVEQNVADGVLQSNVICFFHASIWVDSLQTSCQEAGEDSASFASMALVLGWRLAFSSSTRQQTYHACLLRSLRPITARTMLLGEAEQGKQALIQDQQKQEQDTTIGTGSCK